MKIKCFAILSILLLASAVHSADASVDCGRIIKHDPFISETYIYCPGLAEFQPDQVRDEIDKIIDRLAGIEREMIIYFFDDERILEHTDWTTQDSAKLTKAGGLRWSDTITLTPENWLLRQIPRQIDES